MAIPIIHIHAALCQEEALVCRHPLQARLSARAAARARPTIQIYAGHFGHFNTPFALDTTRSLVYPDPRGRAENPSFRLCAPTLTTMDSPRRETGDGRLTFGQSPNSIRVVNVAVVGSCDHIFFTQVGEDNVVAGATT